MEINQGPASLTTHAFLRKYVCPFHRSDCNFFNENSNYRLHPPHTIVHDWNNFCANVARIALKLKSWLCFSDSSNHEWLLSPHPSYSHSSQAIAL